jgi:ubiquinone/menaquinone biosynthesis C-methylase UbiE
MQVTVNAFHSLAWIEHFGFPVWKPFEKLQVIDVACGTGESSIVSALVHTGTQYLLTDDDAESLIQAKEYAEALALTNVKFGVDGEKGDIVLCTRPLNQIGDLPAQLKIWMSQLASGGVIELQCDTEPASNGIKEARERINHRIETERQALVDSVWIELQSTETPCEWTVPYLTALVESAGLKILAFLHPQMYEPRVYLPEAGELWQQKLQGASLIEQATLAEILAGGIRRHTILCVPFDDKRRMLTPEDANVKSLIPFRSPYAELRRENGQVFFQVERWALPINDAVPMGEVCAPESMAAIYAAIDGKKTLEQLHRRFLPLSWDVFMHFMKLLAENGLLHLHREGK